jgi:hypothetical protein
MKDFGLAQNFMNFRKITKIILIIMNLEIFTLVVDQANKQGCVSNRLLK